MFRISPFRFFRVRLLGLVFCITFSALAPPSSSAFCFDEDVEARALAELLLSPSPIDLVLLEIAHSRWVETCLLEASHNGPDDSHDAVSPSGDPSSSGRNPETEPEPQLRMGQIFFSESVRFKNDVLRTSMLGGRWPSPQGIGNEEITSNLRNASRRPS